MQNNIGVMLHDFGFNPKRSRILFGMTLGTAQHVPGPTKNDIGFRMGTVCVR